MTMPRGRHGDLLSFKTDEAACLAYDDLLLEREKYVERFSEKTYAEELQYLAQWVPDENGMCECKPRFRGVVWSKVMSAPCDISAIEFMGWEFSNHNVEQYDNEALVGARYNNETNANINAW